MASSANTFGTFLQTFGTLEKQDLQEKRPGPGPSMFDLVQELAKRGPREPINKLTWYSENPKLLFDVVFEAQSKGLLTIEEDQGEALATLTSLGKSFAVVA